MRRAVVVATMFLASAPTAQAATTTLAVCSNQTGQAYYAPGGIVPKDKAGWQADRIAGGRTTLSIDDDGNADINFADSTGGAYSAVAEGGTVLLLRRSTFDLAALVVYPAVIEVYQFVRDGDGKPVMLHLQSKGHEMIRKGSLMVASCSYVDFASAP